MRHYTSIKAAFPGLALALACLLTSRAAAQTAQAITLDPPTGWELQAHTMNSKGEMLPPAPANFRRLGEAHVGEVADLHTVTLRFNQTTKITGISVTKDFSVEQGGSCVKGNTYERDTTCRLLVRFTPQGPGNRLGKLTVASSSTAAPMAFGLGGYSYMPVVSFVPSNITTVPGTYPANAGLLSGAWNLTLDGSDSLYIADTGNNAIRYLDSSGTFLTYTTGVTDPIGIAVDTFGDAYFSDMSGNAIYEIYAYTSSVLKLNGTGADVCTPASPCDLVNEALTSPAQMSMDPNNNLFFVDGTLDGAALSSVMPTPTLANISNEFAMQEPFPDAYAVDASDNQYTFWHNGFSPFPNCEIVRQTLYDAENFIPSYRKIVGGRTCGFFGDGGLAGNAQISPWVSQIAFDTGGNMYFTDTANQRVRRVDYNTGIIRTIAGNGTAGYTGDGGGAWGAELAYPTGVAVDSQGQVYIISGAAATGAPEVVRKVGTIGVRNFGDVIRSTHSPAQILIVTNTGNNSLTFTNEVFTGANPGDFAIDPNTTSCLLTAGATLNAGQTCQIGFVFTPTAAGARSANLVLLDNTVTNSNTVALFGIGTLPAATFKITSPANSSSFASSATITFSAKVTSASGPAPTGTVQFKVDGVNHGSPVALSSGTASTTVTGLSIGSHTLSATYSGDSNYAPGGPTSVVVTITAGVANPRVTLAPLMNQATSCRPASFEAVVSNQLGMVPTGLVHLLDGTRELVSASLADGRATLAPPALGPGDHSLTARYDGDAHDHAAVSTPFQEVVSQTAGCSLFAHDPALPSQAGAR